MREKVYLFLFVMAVMVLGLAACGGESTSDDDVIAAAVKATVAARNTVEPEPTITPTAEPTIDPTAEPTVEPTLATSPRLVSVSLSKNEVDERIVEQIEVVEVLNNANLRSGPGTDFAIVGTAFAGDTYSYAGWTNNGWVQLDELGEVWIGLSLVEIKSDRNEPIDTTEPEPNFEPTVEPTTTSPRPTVLARPTETFTPVPSAALNQPAGETAVVTYVTDGDTIIVDLNGVEERVRYIGIDTPEVGETCADEATRANAALVSGKTVSLVKDVSDRDRYGRLLRYVYIGGTFVNAELVKEGWAIAYRYEPDTSQATYLESLQAGATARTCEIIPTNPPPPTDPPPTQPPPPPPPPADNPPTVEPPPAASCSPYYPSVCIPPKSEVGDLDCGEISFRRFSVLQPDPHGFDRDKDGVGCESG